MVDVASLNNLRINQFSTTDLHTFLCFQLETLFLSTIQSATLVWSSDAFLTLRFIKCYFLV